MCGAPKNLPLMPPPKDVWQKIDAMIVEWKYWKKYGVFPREKPEPPPNSIVRC